MNIATYSKVTRVVNGAAAGTGATDGSAVNMGTEFSEVSIALAIGR